MDVEGDGRWRLWKAVEVVEGWIVRGCSGVWGGDFRDDIYRMVVENRRRLMINVLQLLSKKGSL